MTDDIRLKYDAMCYAIMLNVGTLSKHTEAICFKGFNPKNEEHLCVLAVTMACSGILGDRDVHLDCGLFARKALARKYRGTCTISKLTKEDNIAIDICEVIEYMRPACDGFTFADIYNEYYKGDK